MEKKKEMPDAVDYTMLSTYQRCARRYYYRFICNIIPNKRQVPLEFGKAMHKALDEWYTSHDVQKAVEVLEKDFTDCEHDNKRTIAVGRKMLQLYDSQYKNQNHKTIKTELAFELPMPAHETIKYIGRIDKILDWEGAICVMDHKTTTRLGYQFFYKIRPNNQFVGYLWAAQQLGYTDCDTAILDALLAAKGLLVSSQLQRLVPNGRDVIQVTREDIEEWSEDVKAILDSLQRSYDTDTWCRRTDACTDFNQCPYRAICKEPKAIRENIMKQDYIVNVWDPRDDM